MQYALRLNNGDGFDKTILRKNREIDALTYFVSCIFSAIFFS